MEMTRPGGTVATPNLKVDASQALGNPHRTRVPTFPQRRRRLDSYEARSRTPLESWAPSDSCTEPNKDWFVPANIAVQGLTPDQANWTDGKGNHSIGQLAYHLVFWNSQVLARFKGETPAKFSGNNDETFTAFDAKRWSDTVQQLDRVLLDLEKFVGTADEKTIEKNASTIAHVGTHNAYHIGQIIYIRRLQGSWDPENGVK